MDKFKRFLEKNKKVIFISIGFILGFILAYISQKGILGDSLGASKNEGSIITSRSFNDDKIQFIPYWQFALDLEDGSVSSVFYNTGEEYVIYTVPHDDRFEGLSADEKRYGKYYQDEIYKTYYIGGDNYRSSIIAHGADLHFIQMNNDMNSFIVMQAIVSAALLLFMFMSFKKMIPGSSTHKFEIANSDVHFDDIIGIDEIIDTLRGLVKAIKVSSGKEGNSSTIDKLGYKVSKGILLCGPGGIGKTMIAKAIACESGLPLYSCSGSDFVQMYVGVGAKRVRELFDEARKNAPCIVFIDEFDSLATKRSASESNGEYDQTVDAFLKEMDGFTKRDGVFVLAATNHPEKLDKAAVRSGRFDRRIDILPPRDWTVRQDLFKKYLSDKPLADDVNLESLARTTAGFTGADIATVCNEASFIAFMKGLDVITLDNITEAIDNKIFNGNRSKSKKHERDQEVVSYHEAGHATMRHLLKMKISRISVIGTTSGVGGVVFGADSDTSLMFKKDYINEIKVLMAGRAAEEVFFGDYTTGAINDIEKATELLYQYIGIYGFDNKFVNLDILQQNGCSCDDTVNVVYTIASKLYTEVLDIIKHNTDKVKSLHSALIEKGELLSDEVTDILNKA